MLRKAALFLFLLLFTGLSVQAQTDAAHPHLWITADDLPRLRSWATDSNPLYSEGLALMAANAVELMDSGVIPAQDTGSVSYEEYPTESFAALFAFMSLVDPDEAARQDYAARSRTLLMYVMDQAVLGQADAPFRYFDFAITDRSRWYGANFGLTVDWIYPTLTAEDKATIRTVFLRWAEENKLAATTNNNHPVPVDVVNDPVLVSDQALVRWAGNNYYAAHMRNIGLMALSFDAADDPDGALGAYLTNATGAWLYVIDHLLRTDALGGLGTEGFEYSPQSLGYTAQFMLALETAGANDPAVFGPQVTFDGNPFWQDAVIAYFSSIAPIPVLNPDYGQMVYQPAWYGSAQNYWMPDYIEVFGPLGIHAERQGDTTTLNAARWAQINIAPGGPDELTDRVRSGDSVEEGILYFLLFDPAAPTPTDPRPPMPLTWYAPGVRRLLGRTSWGDDAALFSYSLTWNTVDHQSGNGNAIEFYRDGEWLTKVGTGYDLDYHTSDHLNTITIANTIPPRDDFRLMIAERGSQWAYSAGEPPPPVYSYNDRYVYASGDSTNLYNSVYEEVTAVQHVSRSVVWLKPDVVVVYDRGATGAADPFVRFWLNFPANATVSGNLTTMTTASGQQLFTQTLLPVGANIQVSELVDEASAPPANLEPMRYRLMVEAPRDQSDTRMLHILQGADAGAAAQPAGLIDSSEGTPFQGAVITSMGMDVMFPVDFNAEVGSFSYLTIATSHLITGLTPGAGYNLTRTAEGDGTRVTVEPGSVYTADSGGVLLVTDWPVD